MAKLSQETIKERITNKQLKIKLLTKARKKIKAKYTSGICSALEDSVTGTFWGNPQWDAVDELTTYIARSLKDHTYYPAWVRAKDNSVEMDYQFGDYGKFNAKLKKSRQAWIDWMIKCLQEDVDKLKGKLK